MDERLILQFRVGVVVVAAAIITAVLILLVETPTFFRGQYRVFLVFREAPGVNKDTPVRKSGVVIGRVADVKLLDEGGVLVTADIFDDYPLRRNEECRIASGSLLGDAVLEFGPSDVPNASTELVQDGEYIDVTVVAGDPMRVLMDLAQDVPTALRAVESAGDEISSLARSMNGVVGENEEQIVRIVQKAELAMDDFRTAMQGINGLMGPDSDLKPKLERALQDFPELVEQAKVTLATTNDAMAEFKQTSLDAQAVVADVKQVTAPLAERGPELAESIQSALANLDASLEQMEIFSTALNNREGTLGKLIYDREMYDRLEGAVGTVEGTIRKLDPILADARIFADKIARRPSLLGVGGALNQRPSNIKPRVWGGGRSEEPAMWIEEEEHMPVFPADMHSHY